MDEIKGITTIDQALEKIGSCGFYQIRLVFLLAYLAGIAITFQVSVVPISGADPPWHCADNSSVCNKTGLFRAGDPYYNERCNMKRNDWEFSDQFTSIITEFNLVCESAILGSLPAAILFFGWLTGALVGGVLADKYGRKTVMIPFCFSTSLFGVLSGFPTTLWLYTLLRSVVGFSIGASLMPIFVIVVEYVGVSHRHIAGTAIWIAGETGPLIFIGLAFAIRDWRYLTITSGACGLPSIVFWWFLPESARFLKLKGKTEQTERVLRKISVTNNKPYPEELDINYGEGRQKQRMGSCRDLFRTWKMTRITCVSCASWFVNALVYYGVVFSSPNLGTNMYFSYTMTTIVNIPAHFVCIYCMGRFGRKKTVICGLISASAFSMATVLLTMYNTGASKGNKHPKEFEFDVVGFFAGQLITAMMAKFGINVSFDAIYVYSAELFPTVVRNIGLDTSSACARIGSIASPFIISLNQVHPLLPYAILGGASLVAGILCLTLPETSGCPTVEVMDATQAKDDTENQNI